MANTTRRQFARQAALAAASLYGSPFAGFAQSLLTAEESGQTLVDAAAIRKLASQMSGQVVTPQMIGYDALRLVFNRAFDRHPALIACCTSSSDVAYALEFAQTRNLPLAVRAGGHNRAGFSVCDGGVVIDLSAMNRVDADEGKRVARAGAGALVHHMDSATQRVGLATTMGGCPTVGIAGLTLGGGEGLLMSKYGAACDNLISAKVVLVDGREVEASQSVNPDLFWAIRGGGGNFGVVTALEYHLHPVTDVLAGTLTYRPGRIPELLQAFAKFVASAPDEMNVVGGVLPTPQGRQFWMMVCHCGNPLKGNQLLAPLRALKPHDEKITVLPYLEFQRNAGFLSAPVAHFQTDLFLPKLTEAAIKVITTATADAPPSTKALIVPLYGAISRVPVGDTAFALRRPGYEIDIVGLWNTPAEKESAIRWVKALRDELQPLAQGVYANQLGETSDDLVRSAYGSNFARLAALKKKYDPANILRLNQNIKPALAE